MHPLPTAPVGTALPAGCGFALADGVKVCDQGRTVVGGQAGSVLRLSPAAAQRLELLPLVVTADPADPADPVDARLGRRLLDAGVATPWWPDEPPADELIDDVTVVVPVLDRPAQLAALLAHLPEPVRVVVVDDGSVEPEPLAQVAARYGACVVRHPDTRGPAAARNTGLAEVDTPFVAFVDSDCEPVPGWLGQLRRHLDDPAVAMVAPRIVGRESSADPSWIDRYEHARSSLDLGPLPAQVQIRGKVSYVPSACLVARVAALGEGFDSALQCGEDVDLVWRLLAARWRVRYEPAARVRHDHRTDFWSWLGRKSFYGTSAAPLAARHGDAVAPMVLTPWSVVLSVAVLAQRRWSGPAAALALGIAGLVTRRRVAHLPRPTRTAIGLVSQGSVSSLWQLAAALNRHYWPLALCAAVVSARARRALLIAAVGEALADRHRVAPGLPLLSYGVAHRLDDLAYGAGLWRGALRARSARALIPAMVGFARSRKAPNAPR